MSTIVETLLFIVFILLAIGYEWYTSPFFWIFVVVFFLMLISEFVHFYMFQLIAVLIGVIYFPLNLLLLFLSKQIVPFEQEDKFVFAFFKILFFPLQVIVTILSIPYEYVIENAH